MEKLTITDTAIIQDDPVKETLRIDNFEFQGTTKQRKAVQTAIHWIQSNEWFIDIHNNTVTQAFLQHKDKSDPLKVTKIFLNIDGTHESTVSNRNKLTTIRHGIKLLTKQLG